MKVLLVSSFLHHRGGDSTCMFLEAAELEKRGHTVVPFAMRHPANVPSPWEVRFPPWLEVWSARGPARLARVAQAIWSPDAARALDALLRDHRPDVAHVHHLHRHLTPSVLPVLRAHGIPVAWTVHDYELICPSGHLYAAGAPCTRCRGHRYHEAVRLRCKRDDAWQSAAVALEKWVHARRGVWDLVDAFVCPSRFLADRLVEFGVPAARVVHLPNGVAEAPAGGEPGAYWLYAGRLSPEKGVDDLLAAAARLPDRELVLLGDGPMRPTLRPPPNVRVVGAVPPEEVGAWLRGAGAVAVPSRWPENFPYAVLEAQMAARGVVATRVGGIPEQIDDGRDGVLIEPGDVAGLAGAVGGLLGDPRRAEGIGRAARARVLRERAVGGWIERVESLLAGL